MLVLFVFVIFYSFIVVVVVVIIIIIILLHLVIIIIIIAILIYNLCNIQRTANRIFFYHTFLSDKNHFISFKPLNREALHCKQTNKKVINITTFIGVFYEKITFHFFLLRNITCNLKCVSLLVISL